MPDDKFRWRYYLAEDAVYNFVNCMVEESKYWNDLMKKTFQQGDCDE